MAWEDYDEWYEEFVNTLEDYGVMDAPPKDNDEVLEMYDEGLSPYEAADIIDAEYTDDGLEGEFDLEDEY